MNDPPLLASTLAMIDASPYVDGSLAQVQQVKPTEAGLSEPFVVYRPGEMSPASPPTLYNPLAPKASAGFVAMATVLLFVGAAPMTGAAETGVDGGGAAIGLVPQLDKRAQIVAAPIATLFSLKRDSSAGCSTPVT